MTNESQTNTLDPTFPGTGAMAHLPPTAEMDTARAVTPQGSGGSCGCGLNGGAAGPLEARSYVYAIGRIEARFPTLSVEKEFAQAVKPAQTAGKTDHATMMAVLSDRKNRYLARQMCWVFTIQGMDTYILIPRDADIELFVEALRDQREPNDIDVVIGMRGGIAPPGLCNGLMVPVVEVDQIYSFSRQQLLNEVPRPKAEKPDQFVKTVGEIFNRVMLMTDNAGATAAHRALNYLAMRYPAVYTLAAEQFAKDCSLTSVDVRPAALRIRPITTCMKK